MKLRYYLRGIGIGMAVTAMILHFSVNASTPEMTDEEIIARAEALGMIENTVLSANDPALDETVQEDALLETEEPSGTEVPVEESSSTQEEEQAEEPEETETSPLEEDISPAGEEAEESFETQQEGMTGNEAVEEYVVITIVSGDSSVSVAGKLADAGLVSSKAEYDAYLCANGYDRRICTGNHEIPLGATEKEIAEIITTRP